MADSATVMISVRGDAEQVVPPDRAVVHSAIRTVAPSKAEALRRAADAQETLGIDLGALGAVRFTADAPRRPVSWLTRSATTQPEFDFDDRTGRQTATGNVVATVTVELFVRDFARLDDVDAVLSRQPLLHVDHVAWQVDGDNPAWPAVRAAAIHAAIARGRDYAAALGGELLRIEQVADAGLLGEPHAEAVAARGVALASYAGEPQTPSLDPVPQRLYAVIDARLAASAPALS